ncbi:MAG: DUF1553 domain-containing protein [Verrucomicrobiales bacterium]|nr:DUF1553 domain-containing protein [Verrucomicrobiales bacterium]
MKRSSLLISAVILLPLGATGADPFAVLEKNCISCHNTHDRKGDVVLDRMPLGIDDARAIIDSISGPDPDMPKGRDALKPEEVAALTAWVEAGASIPGGRVLEDTHVPGRDWWSLQPIPIQQGLIADPTGSDRNWAKNAIDAFVIAKLREKNLTPSPEAEPAVLVRRLHFNLTGLPPAPEQVTAFVEDYARRGEPAYRALVDALLDSPAHGEHFARHWLDVARYGETHGYDKDKPRPNAWPYRDYVIGSLNADKPWSQFVREQVAGDVLAPGDPQGIVALGFIAAGPWDLIAHVEVGEGKLDGRIAKHMDRDDMVSAVFNAFMSTTAQCAQCHHHKFDPVSMEDYYRLHAVFAAVDRADRVYDLDPVTQKRREGLAVEIGKAEAGLKAIDKRIADAGGAELSGLKAKIRSLTDQGAGKIVKAPEFGYHSQISADPNMAKWVQIELPADAGPIREIVLTGAHDDFGSIGSGFGFPVRYRVELSSDPAFARDVTVLVDRTGADVPNPGIVPVTIPAAGATGARHVRLTATKLAKRSNDYILALAEMAVIGMDGKNLAAGAPVTSLDTIESGSRWGRRNLVDGKFPTGGDPEATRQLAELRSAEQALLDRLNTPEIVGERAALDGKLAGWRKELAALPAGKMVYAAATHFTKFGGVTPTEGKPREIRLLRRGDIKSPGPVMKPGAPALWAGIAPEFRATNEGEARAALAAYLTAPENPLAWRSIANRVWLWHFGRGIVDSPNDFGRMGMEPTHPELLDYLAAALRDDPKQSLKSLHRLIVTSATWRQGSAGDPAKAAVDGENAYYWRANRRRLSAEELRDAVLVAAGKLNREMGGPSFQDFVIEKPEHSPHYQYHLHDHNDPKSHRRSIYRMIARSQTQPFLTTLDCADPSQMVAKRDETTTALQALALLNNPFMTTMAGHFAARVKGNADPVGAAFAIVTGRAAREEERAALAGYADAHGLENACRVMMNLSEFAYVD